MKTLLSIDFDFWAEPKSFNDWGYKEAPFFINTIWPIRASEFIARGQKPEEMMVIPHDEPKPLDLPNLVGKTKNLAVAESHGAAFDFFKRVRGKDYHLINIDAHHDLGYGTEELECGNWVSHLLKTGKVAKVTQVYPKWRHRTHQWGSDWGLEARRMSNEWKKKGISYTVCHGLKKGIEGVEKPHSIFLCRSGAWVPPWLDEEFLMMVNIFGIYSRTQNFTLYNYKDLKEFQREFDRGIAEKLGEQMKAEREKWERTRDESGKPGSNPSTPDPGQSSSKPT